MSRSYAMHIEITGSDPAKQSQIEEVLREHWSIDYFAADNASPLLVAEGESSLCGGESEEEFADRIAGAVWKVNGSYCEVMVTATYLDELPYEVHTRDESDYTRLNPAQIAPVGINELLADMESKGEITQV